MLKPFLTCNIPWLSDVFFPYGILPEGFPHPFLRIRIQFLICPLTAVLLELPISVVERAHLTGLEPPRNAVEMERVL